MPAYIAITKPSHAVILDKMTHGHGLYEQDYKQYINIDKQKFLWFQIEKGTQAKFTSYIGILKTKIYIGYTQDANIHKE